MLVRIKPIFFRLAIDFSTLGVPWPVELVIIPENLSGV
jgi:hypothetical protein